MNYSTVYIAQSSSQLYAACAMLCHPCTPPPQRRMHTTLASSVSRARSTRDRAGCTRHYTSIGIRTVFRCTVALHCRAPSPLWRPRHPATYLLRGGRHAHATRATGGLRRTPRAWAAQEIYALEGCHQSNPYAKFWGVCNDHKLALDRCFKAEVRFPPTARGPLASLSF